MQFLILLAKYIDRINDKIGLHANFAMLIAVIICGGNALVRYAFNTSSNGWLEIQWYLFSAVFLLGAAHTLHKDEHIRIDVFSSKLSARTRLWIDVFGLLFFLFPMTLITAYYAIPFALQSITNQEVSSNAGGLIVWPAKLLIPLGFILLSLQGLSELIKRVAMLKNIIPLPAEDKHQTSVDNHAI